VAEPPLARSTVALMSPLPLAGQADPALAALNPGVALPDAAIAVVRRADGSGTSFIFTNYLSKVNAEWQAKVGEGTAVNWPTGAGGKAAVDATANLVSGGYTVPGGVTVFRSQIIEELQTPTGVINSVVTTPAADVDVTAGSVPVFSPISITVVLV